MVTAQSHIHSIQTNEIRKTIWHFQIFNNIFFFSSLLYNTQFVYAPEERERAELNIQNNFAHVMHVMCNAMH